MTNSEDQLRVYVDKSSFSPLFSLNTSMPEDDLSADVCGGARRPPPPPPGYPPDHASASSVRRVPGDGSAHFVYGTSVHHLSVLNKGISLKSSEEFNTPPPDLQSARRVLSTVVQSDSPCNGDVQLPCPNFSVAHLLSDRVPLCAAAVNVAHIQEWSRISRN